MVKVPSVIWKSLMTICIGAALLSVGLWGRYAGWFGPGVRVLEGLSCQPGDSIVGFDLKWENDDPVSKRVGDFYVDDPAVLKRISAEWVSGGPAPFFLCGYNYSLYLVSNGEIKDKFQINLEKGCNTIVGGKGPPHWFSPRLIEMFERDLKKPRMENKTFRSLASARQYLASARNDPKFLMLIDPEWRRFEGKFRFHVSCDPAARESASSRYFLDSITSRIRKKYPSEEFLAEDKESSYKGGRLTDMTIEVTCSEAFMRKFDLFEVKKDSWIPLKLSLTVVFS